MFEEKSGANGVTGDPLFRHPVFLLLISILFGLRVTHFEALSATMTSLTPLNLARPILSSGDSLCGAFFHRDWGLGGLAKVRS